MEGMAVLSGVKHRTRKLGKGMGILRREGFWCFNLWDEWRIGTGTVKEL